jgi:hypothetical protein
MREKWLFPLCFGGSLRIVIYIVILPRVEGW